MKIAAVAALAGLLALPLTAAPWDIPQLEEHVYKTNVLLNDGCSGTIIDADAGLILTAHHCKKTTQKVELRVYDGPTVVHQTVTPAEVVAEDEANDLLLLRVDVRLPYTLEATLYEGDPPVGSDVWLVGNPMGVFDSTVSKGILGSKHERKSYGPYEDVHVWVIDARAIGGNSGGAAYVDGKLVGVLSAGVAFRTISGASAPVGINFIVPLPTVTKFLASYDAA